jgi:hypothetical protein
VRTYILFISCGFGELLLGGGGSGGGVGWGGVGWGGVENKVPQVHANLKRLTMPCDVVRIAGESLGVGIDGACVGVRSSGSGASKEARESSIVLPDSCTNIGLHLAFP